MSWSTVPHNWQDWYRDSAGFDQCIQADFTHAVDRAVAHHHCDGLSVPIWNNGQVSFLNQNGQITGSRPDQFQRNY